MILHEKDRFGNLISRSFCSRVTFSWIAQTLKHGNKSKIQEVDLLELTDKDSAEQLSQRLEKTWKEEETLVESNPGRKGPLLLQALIKCFTFNLVILLILVILDFILRVLMPVLVGLLVRQLQTLSERTESKTPYIYVGALGGVAILYGVLRNSYLYKTETLGAQFKTAIMGLMYKKLLRLSQKSIHDVTSSHLIALFNNDCERIGEASFFIAQIAMFPFEIIVITALAWQHVGWLSIVASGFVVFLVLLQGMMGRICVKLCYKIMRESSRRVNLISEMILGIRTVKMNVWEWPIRTLVRNIRSRELKFLRRSKLLSSLQQILQFCSHHLVSFIIFPSLVFLGVHLTPEKIITTTALYICLVHSALGYMSRALLSIPEAYVALQRIEHFMREEELRQKPDNCSQLIGNSRFFVNAGFDPLEAPRKASIKILSFNGLKSDAAKGDCLEVEEKLENSCRVSFKSASFAWSHLRTSSTVLHDISLEFGEKPLVGVTGCPGSGKTALLLAILKELPLLCGNFTRAGRIVYVPQVPWVCAGTLRDNILFDAPYAEERYWKVIYACALDKDVGEFPNGDLTLIGKGGISLTTDQRGRVSLARAAYCQADVYLFDDPFSCLDNKTGQDFTQKVLLELLPKSCRILVSRDLELLEHCDHVIILKDGRFAQQGTYAELKEALESMNSRQEAETNNVSADTIPVYEIKHAKSRTLSSSSNDSIVMTENTSSYHDHGEVEEDRLVGTLPWSLYWKYFRSGRSTLVLIFLAMVLLAGQVILMVTDWWLARWSRMNFSHQQDRNNTYIFYGLVVLSIFLVFIRALSLFLSFLKTSAVFHDDMITAVLKARVSFFDANPDGKIIKRFSKDVAKLDELLPHGFIESIQSYLFVTSIIALSIAVNYWVSIAGVPLMVSLVCLRRYVLRSTKDLNRLEKRYRRDAISHCSTTLAGLTCIRAFKTQERFLQRFYEFLDTQSRPYVMFFAGTRWLCLRVDLLCSLFITIIGVAAVLTTADAAYTGLSLLYAIQLLRLTHWGIQVTSETENTMASFERISMYIGLDPEPGYASKHIHLKDWPHEGAIKCEDVSLAYNEGGPEALKSIDLKILPKEKIAVVGQKGAGKSSLAAALLRMPEPSGRIIIDGLDIAQLSLRDLRRRIVYVPQEPFLLSTSFRFNLDPLDKYKDEDILRVLEQLKLDKMVQSNLRKSSSHYTKEERKLIYLARPLLQGQRIIVIEEDELITDSGTDDLIQEIIRTHFQDCTVITIAHRLETIMASDRVAVMRDGRVLEFDSPEELSCQDDSELVQLLSEASY